MRSTRESRSERHKREKAARKNPTIPVNLEIVSSPKVEASAGAGLDRIYMYLLLELLCFVVACLYLSFTIQIYPYNYVWFLLFVALTIFGFIMGLLPSLIGSMFVVFGYGSFLMYKLFISRTIVDVTFNDLFWLAMFPLGSITVGLFAKDFFNMHKKFKKYEAENEVLVSVDMLTGFSNYRKFIRDLEEETSRAVRYHRSMTVLLVEIAYFNELKKEYGEDTVAGYLRQLSEKISIVLRDVDKKAYIDDGLFAGILPETNVSNVQIVIKRIEEQIQNLFLETSKGAKQIKVKLKFGFAGCPENSTVPMELYDTAKQGLIYYVG